MNVTRVLFSAVIALAPATIGIASLAPASAVVADALTCDLAQYAARPGLTATVVENLLVVSWSGQGSAELRARYAIDDRQLVVRDLAIRKAGGPWAILGQNLTPEYHVTSGIRRMSDQQAQPLRQLGVQITQAVIDKNRWYAFWDAPLVVPGTPPPATGRGGMQDQVPQAAPTPTGEVAIGRGERVYGLPRRPEEIRHATASFNTNTCAVKTDGGSLAVTFPGLTMGIFVGSLRFTVYRGTNLVRMDAVAKTEEPWVAYKYEAGLKGLSTDLTSSVG